MDLRSIIYAHAEAKNIILCLDLYVIFSPFKLLIMQTAHAKNSAKFIILLKSFQYRDPNQRFTALSLLQRVCS